MKFAELEAAVGSLTLQINKDLGRQAIQPITLTSPIPPPDQLYFDRLVAWCYGFFFEAAIDVLKVCKALMKQNSPDQTNKYDKGMRTINCLRTFKFHNMPPGRSNDKKVAQAEAWLSDFDTSDRGIERASETLCADASALVEIVRTLWTSATADKADMEQLVGDVLQELDKQWHPHEMHDIVREVAHEIDLAGFDAKAFTDEHMDTWRTVGGCFEDRETARNGLRRAIERMMHATFGPGTA